MSPSGLYKSHQFPLGTPCSTEQPFSRELLDLEGIVAKRADSPYQGDARNPHWIKNPSYSQREGRGDLLKRAS